MEWTKAFSLILAQLPGSAAAERKRVPAGVPRGLRLGWRPSSELPSGRSEPVRYRPAERHSNTEQRRSTEHQRKPEGHGRMQGEQALERWRSTSVPSYSAPPSYAERPGPMGHRSTAGRVQRRQRRPGPS
uniref:Putative secreted protein n=1 Tax=Anopheles aquasalis TaxID=42839 RepID=T1DER8_ANOAQ